MESRRAKLIAELIQYLEGMDADELGASMKPQESVVELEVEPASVHKAEVAMGAEGEKGPMEMLAAKGSDPMSEEDDEMDDDEMRERELMLG